MRARILSALVLLALAAPAYAQTASVTRYVQFQQGNEPAAWGELQGDTIHRLSAPPFAGGKRSGQTVPLAAVTLLPPATPRTAVITNVNYPSGLTGTQQKRPHPTLITLPPGAFVGLGTPIRRPVEVKDLRAEATAAVVISRMATNITPEEAPKYILGVAPAVDVTAVDWRSGQWTRAKGADSFKPIGPAVVSGVDYNTLTIVGKHNGKPLPPVRTAEMFFNFDALVSYISRFMTLNPGDVVLAGTAGQAATVSLQAGDTFEVDIEGVGTLRNPVVARPPMTTLPPPFTRK